MKSNLSFLFVADKGLLANNPVKEMTFNYYNIFALTWLLEIALYMLLFSDMIFEDPDEKF